MSKPVIVHVRGMTNGAHMAKKPCVVCDEFGFQQGVVGGGLMVVEGDGTILTRGVGMMVDSGGGTATTY